MDNSAREEIDREFSSEEIWLALSESSPLKSPGPDGLNIAWIKKLWPFISAEVKEFFDKFYSEGYIPQGANSSFIVLIPKKSDPQGIADYRPISLINSIFKLLLKVLANRIKYKLDSLISESQSAFVKGRNIGEGILSINELIHHLQSTKAEGIIIKLDFAKAYDSINWGCLFHLMEVLGFGQKWVSWIRACLSSTRMSVLINGAPTKEFSPHKGVRQGDPLAPYLFIMVAELLSRLLSKAREAGWIEGIQVSSDSEAMTHLQYADDTVLIIQNNEKSIRGVKQVLQLFQAISGLKVNFNKSMIFHPSNDIASLGPGADILQCEIGQIPFKYLGAWVGKNPLVVSFWDPLLASMKQKLANWKTSSLNFAGRATLLQACLDSMPSYWFGLHRIPASVCARMELFRRKFLWGELSQENVEKRSLHLINWQSICAPKNCGGLGLQRIKEKNIAFLGKWWWRFQVDRKKIWHRIVCAKYKIRSSLLQISSNKQSPIIKDILSLRKNPKFGVLFDDSCWHWKPRSGDTVLFWLDDWSGEGVLKQHFFRLFSLCSDQYISVADMLGQLISPTTLSPEIWRRTLRGWELDAERDLISLLGLFEAKQGTDQVSWRVNSGSYSVQDAYNNLVHGNHSSSVWSRIWGLKVPVKIKFFLWKISHGIIPTKQLLLSRIKKGNGICEMCEIASESLSHLFWDCAQVNSVWKEIFNWWHLPPLNEYSQWNSLYWLLDRIRESSAKLAWEVTVCATLWVIWCTRNNKIFQGSASTLKSMLSLIKARACEWCVAEKIIEDGQYISWCKAPELCSKQSMILRKDKFLAGLVKSFEVIAFVDGAASVKKSGVGGVVLDDNLNMIYIFAGPSIHCQSVLVEFEAFLLACSIITSNWSNKRAVICSDSSIVVSQFLRFKSGLVGSSHQLLDFSKYGLSFDKIWAKKIDRAVNQEADFLASIGANRKDLVAGRI